LLGARLLVRTTGMGFAQRSVMARRSMRQEHAVGIGTKVRQRGVAHWFTRFSTKVATLAGSPWAFIIATLFIASWLVSGPIFGFSDTWQLIANTVTTLITTLMVFLIQNTQNRDAKAIHLKLDELLRAEPRARNVFMEAEEEDLDEIVREKEIVDAADPAPPESKKDERSSAGLARPGNGKPKAS
jgi:low affinity Fe/Cu permease